MGDAIVQTAESPVNELAIGSKDEFAKFMTVPEYWSNNTKVKLTCNIDMEGAIFKPIEKFSGEFNGFGYTVSNFGVQDSHELFKKFELAFIKTMSETAVFENVTFDNYSVKDTGSSTILPSSYKAAGLVINNKGYISGVNLKNSSMVNVNKTSNHGKAAGFVLNNVKLNEKKDEIVLNNKADERNLIKGCSIRDCSVEMKTEKSNIDAGFVYSNDRIIQNCESNLNIESKYKGYLGGFCGENLKDGTIVGCNFSGSVKAMNLATAGGFVGVNYGKIMHCNARENVNGGKNVGGFVGRNAAGIISVCKSTGIGIGSIGTVNGIKNIGGFVGLNEAKIVLSNANSKAIAKTVGAFS
ncbi:MAG: hypothetical protein K2G97_04500, partial [Oscillospiraceae bacterium]|nr:hypothetical protein [Oscillospiraceae bacterium]